MDRQLLKAKIKESRLSMGEVAKAAGMDRSTLYRRLASDTDGFTIAEATEIAKLLKLTKRDVTSIFFND